MKKQIDIHNPKKLLPWIGPPFMASWGLELIILLIGFTPYLLFINYVFEVLFLFLFFLSYINKYKCYKAEQNLNITKYFWVEMVIHILFIIGAVVQSALNVRLTINQSGVIYRHEYLFVSLVILLSHAIYMTIDYYITEKVAIIKAYKMTIKNNNLTR